MHGICVLPEVPPERAQYPRSFYSGQYVHHSTVLLPYRSVTSPTVPTLGQVGQRGLQPFRTERWPVRPFTSPTRHPAAVPRPRTQSRSRTHGRRGSGASFTPGNWPRWLSPELELRATILGQTSVASASRRSGLGACVGWLAVVKADSRSVRKGLRPSLLAQNRLRRLSEACMLSLG